MGGLGPSVGKIFLLMKKAFWAIAILMTFLSLTGLFVYRKVADDFSAKKQEITRNAGQANGAALSPASKREGLLKQFGQPQFNVTLKESDIQDLLKEEGKLFVDSATVSVVPEGISVNGKGKRGVSYSFEAKIMPTTDNGALKFKVLDAKAFGLPAGYFKEDIEDMLNKKVATEINKTAKIKKITLKNQQLTISGEQR